MPLGAQTDVTVLNGVPFTDRNFSIPMLFGGVVAVRRMHGQKMNVTGLPVSREPGDWLTPEVAVLTRPGASPLPVRPVPADRLQRIRHSVNRLADILPHWRPLMALPVEFHLPEHADTSLSASSYLWPQHVLLGDPAFDSDEALDELIVHEMCHQWLYLIEELWPFDVPDARRVALPSGTPNRAPREVIGAAHVAAATLCMYQALGVRGGERVELFTAYGHGCLALLDELDTDLTPAGRTIAGHLKEAI